MQHIAITQLSPEDLKTLFKELLEQEISPLKDASAKKFDPLFSREEASERLKIDLSTLHRWTKQGKISAHAIGARIYFKESSIQEALIEIKPKKHRL
jgi:excisionase family DNA binding protein